MHVRLVYETRSHRFNLYPFLAFPAHDWNSSPANRFRVGTHTTYNRDISAHPAWGDIFTCMLQLAHCRNYQIILTVNTFPHLTCRLNTRHIPFVCTLIYCSYNPWWKGAGCSFFSWSAGSTTGREAYDLDVASLAMLSNEWWAQALRGPEDHWPYDAAIVLSQVCGRLFSGLCLRGPRLCMLQPV
jgi:hypothetical protein